MKEIIADINNALDDLIQQLSLFDESQVNKIPFEDSWTPGQVVQHIILSDSGFIDLFNGPVTDTTRQYDEHVATLKSIFLNFDIKMKSPDFILPPAIDYDKEELLHTLDTLKTKLNQFDPASDITKTCTGFQLPNMGYLTRAEALHFMLYHTQRHVHQLKNIYNKINHH